MNADRIARAHRGIRHRLGMRQQDVSDAAGVPRPKISRMENGRLAGISLPEIERSFGALGASVKVVISWQGAGLDGLLDEVHASLVGMVVEQLHSDGLRTRVEVSFASLGDRGSIDVLAWKPDRRALLVVEVMSELGSLDGTLRPLDVKVRHAPRLAVDCFGWRPAVVGRVLVLPERGTARRTVARHSAVLDAALPAHSRDVRRWLSAPDGALAGVWFLSGVRPGNTMKNRSSIRRVRKRQPRSGSAARTPAGATRSRVVFDR